MTDLLGFALINATLIWLLYMAFEPYVRRFWPTLLIGWTRLLSGQVRDPLVGRDILVGAAAGTIAAPADRVTRVHSSDGRIETGVAGPAPGVDPARPPL